MWKEGRVHQNGRNGAGTFNTTETQHDMKSAIASSMQDVTTTYNNNNQPQASHTIYIYNIVLAHTVNNHSTRLGTDAVWQAFNIHTHTISTSTSTSPSHAPSRYPSISISLFCRWPALLSSGTRHKHANVFPPLIFMAQEPQIPSRQELQEWNRRNARGCTSRTAPNSTG